MTYYGADQTRRATRGQNRFANDLIGLSAETDQGSGNPHTTYFMRDNRGTLVGARETTGALHYFLFDGLGSVVGLVNPSGTLTDTYSYEPYGKLLSSTGTTENPFRFASGYLDTPVGWLKFGTRYYEPSIARWTQRDPVRGSLASPPTLNPYLYTSSDPVNATDPSGRVQIGGGWSILEPRAEEDQPPPPGSEPGDLPAAFALATLNTIGVGTFAYCVYANKGERGCAGPALLEAVALVATGCYLNDRYHTLPEPFDRSDLCRYEERDDNEAYFPAT
jgi:RHS repeat-associated protein